MIEKIEKLAHKQQKAICKKIKKETGAKLTQIKRAYDVLIEDALEDVRDNIAIATNYNDALSELIKDRLAFFKQKIK